MVINDGLVELSEFLERIAKVVMCTGVIGFEREWAALAGDSLFELTKAPERIAQIGMCISVIWLNGKCFLTTCRSLV